MIRSLFISSTSACFELENQNAFYADSEYTVSVSGKELFKSNTNVFSVFGLNPSSEYVLEVTGEPPLVFRTRQETCAVSVRDFGAKGDGVTDDTAAIQTALNCLPAGGRLFFPAGTYCTAPLALKSHITLELAEDAVLLGSTDTEQYPVIPGEIPDLVTGKPVPFGTWEGDASPMHQALLFAEYAEDIRIIGRGTVDGNAQNSTWWINARDRKIPRPRLIFLNRCKDITVHGITAQNAASWQLHPYFSEGLRFLDLSVNAPKDSPNTDALDPEACDQVSIIGCRFSVGDDCIAIKSGKIDIGRRYRKPASRCIIRNCLMMHGHGAVTLGSETAGGVRDLTVERCIFRETDRGLRIKTRRGRGKDAVIDGVLFENIRMDGVLTPIAEFLRSFKSGSDAGVVLLAVENRSVCDRARNARLPMLSIGAEQFYGAIGIFQLQNSAECGFLADHAFVPAGSDDLVSPPAWSGLYGELVGCPLLAIEGSSDVICERILRLCVMGETGLEVFFPHRLSIDEQLVNTKSRSHPLGGLNLLAVNGL